MSQRDRAIKHFKRTGQMNAWLKERITWDADILYEIAPILRPSNPTLEWNATVRTWFSQRAVEQFNTESVLFKRLAK